VNKINNFLEVRNFLAGIDYINRGGCGISALAMFLWLEKFDKENSYGRDEKCFILSYEDDVETFEYNSAIISIGELNKLDTPSHVLLFVEDFEDNLEVLDCETDFLVESDEVHRITFYEIIPMINTGLWNSLFERERRIPIIEENLGIDIYKSGVDY
jgi:hypothetical protein